MTMKELTDHWIGMPKSPYVHYTATVSSTTASAPTPTSSPISTAKKSTKQKSKKRKKSKPSNKRRVDSDEQPQYRDDNYRDRDPYSDFDYDYDSYNNPSYNRPTSPSPYIMRSSASSPRTVYVNPSGSSPSASAIFAGIPKIATYVVPSAKKYTVQRVNSHTMLIPPSSSGSTMYASGSNTGMRRQDPMDYDDESGGSYLGPQNGFPPRPVMNKITEAGGRQPCHGPECHQHHKGLVRFYWRRVVYPEGSRRGRRRPGRFRNRRRFRDGGRLPSDQKEFYATDDDEDEEGDPENGEEDEEDEEEDGDESGESTNRRNRWRPKGYGHDLHEGSNYDDDDGKVYRDKRFAYRKHMRRPYK